MLDKPHLAIRKSDDIIELDEVWALKNGSVIWTGTSSQLGDAIDDLGEKGMDTLVVHPDIWEKWKDSGEHPVLERNRLN